MNEITKETLITEILQSGAKYVKTSISIESCMTHIAIRDIEDSEDIDIDNFTWCECSIGLNDTDY